MTAPVQGASASLSVEGVSVVIDDVPILHGIDLHLADGEVVAVLGPSGSGKTSLLRVIAGLQVPTTGTVALDGVDVTHRAVHRRGIGLMFQDHALFPHRDVAANVAFGLRMSGAARSEIGPRVQEVLDLVGLSGFARRSIGSLSGGERQRVALARALAPRPRLLLLDEPLGSLDRALRERLVDDLAQVLRSSGVTAIYVTHDQSEAFTMGDRLAVMRAGTIAQVDSPELVWTAPVDAGVATIVGPVTLVPVEVGDDGSIPPPWDRIVARPPIAPRRSGPHQLVIRADTFSIGDPASINDTFSIDDPTSINDPASIGDPAASGGPAPAGDGAATGQLRAEVVGTRFRGDHHLVVVALLPGPDGLDGPAPGADRIRVAHRGAVTPRPGERVVLRVVHRPTVVPPAPGPPAS